MRRGWIAGLALFCACSSNNSAAPDLAASDDLSVAQDLAGADLAGLDFTVAAGVDLAGADLAGVDQGGGATFVRLYGGALLERGCCVLTASDGSIYVAGDTSSTEGDLTGTTPRGSPDIWVFKLDAQGTLVWSRRFGGSGFDTPNQMVFASDGDLLVVGQTNSPVSGDVTVAYGDYDAWLIKVNAQTGDLRWATSIGGSLADTGTAVRETTMPNGDLEYTVLGQVASSLTGNIVESRSGLNDMLIGRFVVSGPSPSPTPVPNPQGTTFGSTDIELGVGFFGDRMVGLSQSPATGDLTGTSPRGHYDVVILSGGPVVRFGGDQHDWPLLVLPDGAFVGSTGSNSDEVQCNQHASVGGRGEIWVGKLGPAGLVASTCFGGDDGDEGLGMVKLPDGRYVVVASAGSHTGDITAPGTGPMIVVFDSSFQVQTHFFMGGSSAGIHELRSLAVAPDGRVIAVGTTDSSQGVFAGTHGESDVWVQKFDVP
jgi:hypothetical protein